jgi:excisionase family DNA binding protein
MSETTLAFTIADAAKASGLGRTSLYELIGAGKIEARKAGNRTLIPAESLRTYIANLPHAEICTGRHRTTKPQQSAA